MQQGKPKRSSSPLLWNATFQISKVRSEGAFNVAAMLATLFSRVLRTQVFSLALWLSSGKRARFQMKCGSCLRNSWSNQSKTLQAGSGEAGTLGKNKGTKVKDGWVNEYSQYSCSYLWRRGCWRGQSRVGNEGGDCSSPVWALTLQQRIMGRDWQGLLNKSCWTGIRTWCSSKQPNRENSDCLNEKLYSTRWLFKFFIHKKKERGRTPPKKKTNPQAMQN